MEIESTSGNEGRVVAWLDDYLRAAKWSTRRIPVTEGRDALLATYQDKPLVTLSTHLDTVPPYIPPRLAGDTLWGRGACDAKGIAGSMIFAAERLREEQFPIALLFVVGEEVTHDGAEAANKIPTTSRVLINGELTASTLAIGTKGAMRFTLRTRGTAAHSAYPHFGKSAIAELVRLLAEIETLKLPSDPELGETTINIGVISGGVADNVMAPTAEARLMARLATPDTVLVDVLKKWLKGRAEFEQSITVDLARLGTLPGFKTSVAAFATDIPKLTNWGTPYLFGPGSVHFAHRDDEHVKVAELASAVDRYIEIAKAALNRLS